MSVSRCLALPAYVLLFPLRYLAEIVGRFVARKTRIKRAQARLQGDRVGIVDKQSRPTRRATAASGRRSGVIVSGTKPRQPRAGVLQVAMRTQVRATALRNRPRFIPDDRYDELSGDLSRCLSPAAILALVEEPGYAATMGQRSTGAVLDRLTDIGASVEATKIVLREIGLDWMQHGPVRRRFFRLRTESANEIPLWQHESAFCISFENWRARSIFSFHATTPANKCYVFFDAGGKAVGWQQG